MITDMGLRSNPKTKTGINMSTNDDKLIEFCEFILSNEGDTTMLVIIIGFSLGFIIDNLNLIRSFDHVPHSMEIEVQR